MYQISNSPRNCHAPTSCTSITHGACSWLRRKPEYCAQRRTPMNFNVRNAPQIDFLSPFAQFLNFTNFVNFSWKSQISSPWTKIWGGHNFFHKIFWKLSSSESESIWSQLRLDKRKLKTNDRLSSTDQKREKSEPKKSAQDSTNLAPTTIEKYCFTSLV